MGAAVGAVALSSRPAHAEADRLHAFAHELRHKESRARWQIVGRSPQQATAGDSPEIDRHVDEIIGGFTAFSTIKELEALSLEEQAHPSIQRLIGESAEAVGGSIHSCLALLEGFLASDAPDREDQLRASLGRLRLSMDLWPLPTGRRNLMLSSLQRLERERRPGALLRRAEHLVAKMRKLDRLSLELDARGEVGGLPIQDPAALAQIEAGQRRWASEAAHLGGVDRPEAGRAGFGPLPEPHGATSRKTKKIVGILIISIGCVVGALFLMVGLCVLACGSAWGIPLMLLGAAIIAGSIVAGVMLLKQAKGMEDGSAALGPSRPVGSARLAVAGAEGWVRTGLHRRAGQRLAARSSGFVRLGLFEVVDAEGRGEATGEEAWLPGAPSGALVGRVGEDRFFLGSEGLVPEGPEGPLLLAVNRGAGDPPSPKGSFEVALTIYELVALPEVPA